MSATIALPDAGGRRPVVAVAVSGGVDSAVAAALLRASGADVFAVMLRLWAEPGSSRSNACCTPGAVDDAVSVAAALDVPFSVLDVADVFHDRVVAPFVLDSASGDTPNPCLACNRTVRFGWLLERVLALGADYLATGHYARTVRAEDGSFELRRGVDDGKDQSYVLHRLDQAQLRRALFPVGGMTKTEVRAEADRLGLPVARRPDSTDLCWIGDDGVAGFLSRRLAGLEPGPIVDDGGRVLGTHRGLALYTIGQRRGLGVAAGSPLYVTGKDPSRNALVVGPAEHLLRTDYRIRDWHWIGREPAGPLRCRVQVRYRGRDVPASVHVRGSDATVRVSEPQRAPAPGQAVVAYDGDRCLGGGVMTADPPEVLGEAGPG